MQNIHIATAIKTLCKVRGVTITTLLTDCNLTKSFIYDLEKRSTSPSCDKLTRIAERLDCSVDYLLGLTDDPKGLNLTKSERELLVMIRMLDDEQVPLLFEKLDDILSKREEKK